MLRRSLSSKRKEVENLNLNSVLEHTVTLYKFVKEAQGPYQRNVWHSGVIESKRSVLPSTIIFVQICLSFGWQSINQYICLWIPPSLCKLAPNLSQFWFWQTINQFHPLSVYWLHLWMHRVQTFKDSTTITDFEMGGRSSVNQIYSNGNKITMNLFSHKFAVTDYNW